MPVKTSLPTFETRSHVSEIELRAEGSKRVAVGYAAVFNKLSQSLGGFQEMVAPGAFTKTLQEADIRALFSHDPNLVLGRNRSGTLRLEEDNIGLRYEIDLPDTTLGNDVAELLARGDISSSSFGFRSIEDEWGLTDSEYPLRTLRVVALRDVGPTAFPAYLDADLALRSLAESRSLDLNALVAASKHDALQEALSGAGDHKIEEERSTDDGRVTPTVIRRKFAHLAG